MGINFFVPSKLKSQDKMQWKQYIMLFSTEKENIYAYINLNIIPSK